MSSSIVAYGIGFLAQLCFSARVLIQWVLSERKHKVISPTLFWIFSLVGAYIMFCYGWLRSDFSIIFGQFISFYIYVGNLRLKGVWNRIPLILRWLLLTTPLVAALATSTEYSGTEFVNEFLRNDRIPLWLVIFGTIGQVVFTLRFVHQWFYSSKRHESVLPPAFWWISLTGSCIIVIYGVLRYDPILILGQSAGFVSYIRNLMIGHREFKNEVG